MIYEMICSKRKIEKETICLSQHEFLEMNRGETTPPAQEGIWCTFVSMTCPRRRGTKSKKLLQVTLLDWVEWDRCSRSWLPPGLLVTQQLWPQLFMHCLRNHLPSIWVLRLMLLLKKAV